MRLSLFLFVVFSTFIIKAQELPLYYGAEFLRAYQDESLKNENLKNSLFAILSGGHIKIANSPDILVPNCPATIPLNPLSFDSSQTQCEQHTPMGYDSARKKLFGLLYLKKTETGAYSVKDVYCEKVFTDADFGGTPTFGPNMVPISGNIINTEHTWPQSRFTGRFPKETQKSDLHHLFPSDSSMNSHRGSLRFGYVVKSAEPQKCSQNKLGHQAEGGIIFEVPDAQKGNTARAIFYFATRYQMKISPPEEAALRKWDKFDPVDAEEFTRNNQIESLQGNRNPYIDFSELIDRIDHF